MGIKKKDNNNINILTILFFLFISFTSENKILIFDSEIIITIRGNGTQKILNNEKKNLWDFNIWNKRDYSFDIKPIEILVNEKKVNKIDFYVYNLTEEENNITIKFNSTIAKYNVLFSGLSNITKINLKNFDSSKVENMEFMFYDLKNLKSLDLSNLKTSSVTNMNGMFKDCSKLISLDLSNVDTSSVTNFDNIFSGCSSLISLNLSHFDTSSAVNMGSMFYGCSNLIALDLSSFDTSSTTYMGMMFSGCTKLISLDLSNFETNSVYSMRYMFKNCRKLISLDLSNFNTQSVTDFLDIFSGCSNNLIFCIYNKTINNNLRKQIYNKDFIINCSDICFYENKKIIFDNGPCELECNDINKYEYRNICYEICPDRTHNINDNICIKDDDEINNYNIIDTTNLTNFLTNKITNNNEIITSIPFYFTNSIKVINIDSTEIIFNINYNNTLAYLRNEITNNTTYIINIIENEKKDIIINKENKIYQIISSVNQINNKYNNISNIMLGECELKLRNYYNITNDILLLILKIDIFEKELLTPIVEYEIYNSKTKEKLNLNICKYNKIIINMPVSIFINENNLFKFNASHEYYNDICYSYTTKFKTDITLKDRRKEYINNNYFLCDSNCEYKGYDIINKKSKCECFIKKDLTMISEIIKNRKQILKNFIDINNSINLNIIICYMKIFNKEGLLKNLGNYIMSIIILLEIILSILFKVKGYNDLKIKINEIDKNIKLKNPPKKFRTINIMKTNDEAINRSGSKIKLNKSNVCHIIINNTQTLIKKKNKKI